MKKPADGFDILRSRDDLGLFLNRLDLNGIGAEIGVYEGEFSEQLLSTWTGSKLFLIDPWRHLPDYLDSWNGSNEMMDHKLTRTRQRLERFGERAQIIRSLSAEAAVTIPNSTLDFVYIDGNHAFDYVKKDLETWYAKVRSGGLVGGHDYFDADADEALEPILSQPPMASGTSLTSYGVRSAVDQFVGFLKVGLFVTDDIIPSWFFFKE